jgi:hypothetical protein
MARQFFLRRERKVIPDDQLAPPPAPPVFQRPDFSPPPIPETGPLMMPNISQLFQTIPQVFQNLNFSSMGQNFLPSWYQPTAAPPQFQNRQLNTQSGVLPNFGAIPTLGNFRLPFKG